MLVKALTEVPGMLPHHSRSTPVPPQGKLVGVAVGVAVGVEVSVGVGVEVKVAVLVGVPVSVGVLVEVGAIPNAPPGLVLRKAST